MWCSASLAPMHCTFDIGLGDLAVQSPSLRCRIGESLSRARLLVIGRDMPTPASNNFSKCSRIHHSRTKQCRMLLRKIVVTSSWDNKQIDNHKVDLGAKKKREYKTKSLIHDTVVHNRNQISCYIQNPRRYQRQRAETIKRIGRIKINALSRQIQTNRQ